MEQVKISDNLSKQLDTLNEEQYNAVMKMFKHYYSEYKRIKKTNKSFEKEIAQKLNELIQKIIDKGINEAIEQSPKLKLSCRKGCSFCCFQSVDVSDDEALLINHVVKEKNINIDYERLENQLVKDRDEFNKLPHKIRKCVFLGKDNSCQIYNYRPTSCRKLVVVSDPKYCDTERELGDQQQRLANLEAEVISCASFHATNSGSMAEMLLKLKK